MHFHYECNARGLDGKADGNLPVCEIVCGKAWKALDGKADGNFYYKMYYFPEAPRWPLYPELTDARHASVDVDIEP